ncbi:kinase-like protein [Fomitiporia mediterranea MF3/22]|uniref:kinase-like protein n=1 Tax=Fomitiporia mediterranea (strain MF3/22) TaxID=694068 RepID=UPI0004409A50|nr:kinase-like protein [Fomitiporia mediterranea MF3/22]EJD03602.1 kinase-like protein [Fomitiporia mediterranea MF3/22]
MARAIKDLATKHYPGDPLNDTLAKLAHLDLTGSVRYDPTVMQMNGGYSDIFVGTAAIPLRGTPPSNRAPRPEIKVSVKRLRIHIQKDKSFEKSLARELSVWSKLDHANILPLQGFIMEGSYPLVIAQWMENGTVREYLQRQPMCDIKSMVVGIAHGIGYLHKKNVVHSDLKADNVLVNHFGRTLICDFGLSRMLCASTTIGGAGTSSLSGTVRWMARELIVDSDGRHTKESDVWAFGMTVFEMLTRQRPYPDCKTDPNVIFAISKGELPPRPVEYHDWTPTNQDLWDICESCWVSPPEHRITAWRIIGRLKNPNFGSDRTNQGTRGRDRQNDLLAPGNKPARNSTSRESQRTSRSDNSQTGQERKDKSPDVAHPQPPTISPLLRGRECMHLDFAFHAYLPQIPSNNNDKSSRTFVAAHNDQLFQAAVVPGTTNMRITCKAFGKFVDTWAITVRSIRRPITIGHVLSAMHQHMQTKMTHEEWAKLSEPEVIEAGQAYTRRCREAEFEKMQGVRRLDLLGKKRFFGGLKKAKGDVDYELIPRSE